MPTTPSSLCSISKMLLPAQRLAIGSARSSLARSFATSSSRTAEVSRQDLTRPITVGPSRSRSIRLPDIDTDLAVLVITWCTGMLKLPQGNPSRSHNRCSFDQSSPNSSSFRFFHPSYLFPSSSPPYSRQRSRPICCSRTSFRIRIPASRTKVSRLLFRDRSQFSRTCR